MEFMGSHPGLGKGEVLSPLVDESSLLTSNARHLSDLGAGCNPRVEEARADSAIILVTTWTKSIAQVLGLRMFFDHGRSFKHNVRGSDREARHTIDKRARRVPQLLGTRCVRELLHGQDYASVLAITRTGRGARGFSRVQQT